MSRLYVGVSYQFSIMHILSLFYFSEVLELIKGWLIVLCNVFPILRQRGKNREGKVTCYSMKNTLQNNCEAPSQPISTSHLWEAFPKPVIPEQHKWTWTWGILFMDSRFSQPGYNHDFLQLRSPETLLLPTRKFFLYLQFIFQSFSHQQGFLEWAPDLSQSLEIAQYYHKLLSEDPALRSCPTKELLA